MVMRMSSCYLATKTATGAFPVEKRSLGRTGLSIAPIVFGGNVFGWTADEKTSFALLDAFFDAGFNAIDTADVYSAWVDGHVGGESETIIGKWLKQSSVKREDAVIVTKVGFDNRGQKTGLSAKWIEEAVEASLKRLQTDYIDLYLAHKPDADVPLEETPAAFGKLKEQGKIRAIGCSNYSASQLQEALDTAAKNNLPRYDVLQPEYNLYNRKDFEGPLAELVAQRRAEDRRELLLQPLLGADRGVHAHRIGDAETREGVDLEPLLVGRQHLLAFHVHAENALVDILDAVGEGHAQDEPGARMAEALLGLVAVHGALDLPKAEDQRLLVLGDDRKRLRQDDEQRDGADEQAQRMAEQALEHHWPPFAAASGAAFARRWTSFSGR